MKVHPAAELFPKMSLDNRVELAKDIMANGLRNPILLDQEGRILDGRNRYEVCRTHGIEPKFETWDGEGDPINVVLSLNLHRRHLSSSQRAMVAAKVATMRQGARTDLAQICAKSQTEAADQLNVSRRSVQHARTVQEHGTPELVEAVESGDVAVSRAAAAVTLPTAPAEHTDDPVREFIEREFGQWTNEEHDLLIDIVGSIEHLAKTKATPFEVVQLIDRSYADTTEECLEQAIAYLNEFAKEWRSKNDTIEGN